MWSGGRGAEGGQWGAERGQWGAARQDVRTGGRSGQGAGQTAGELQWLLTVAGLCWQFCKKNNLSILFLWSNITQRKKYFGHDLYPVSSGTPAMNTTDRIYHWGEVWMWRQMIFLCDALNTRYHWSLFIRLYHFFEMFPHYLVTRNSLSFSLKAS